MLKKRWKCVLNLCEKKSWTKVMWYDMEKNQVKFKKNRVIFRCICEENVEKV